MNPIRCSFVRQFVAAAVGALIPVVLVAFWSIPFNVGGHPGEARAVTMPTPAHMT